MFKLESKIIGINILWITMLVFILFTLVLLTGGSNIDIVTLFFEIFMPVYMMIVICETVKTKFDPAIENILINAVSYFRLVVARYCMAFGFISILSILYMCGIRVLFREFNIVEMILTFLAPSFFLSSFGLVISFLSRNEHSGSIAGGLLWFFNLLAYVLMQKGALIFFFMFESFFSTKNIVWIINKSVFIILGFILWYIIYAFCQERRFLFNIGIRKIKLLIMAMVLGVLLLGANYMWQFLNGVSSPVIDGERNQKWLSDVKFLQENLPSKHKNLFFKLHKEDFYEQIESMKNNISILSDDELKVKLSEIIALVGDTHTGVIFETGQIFPFHFYWFKEGVYCIDTAKQYEDILYKRLIKVNGTDIDEVLSKLKRVISSENEFYYKDLAVKYIVIPEILNGLHLSDGNEAEFVFRGSMNETTSKKVIPVNKTDIKWIDDQNSKTLPLYRKNNNKYYWFEYIKEHDTIYLKYNDCKNMNELPFEVITKEIFTLVEEKTVKKLIVDLRDNGGGDSSVFNPFFEELKKHPEINNNKMLYVVTGRKTFSSAVLNAVDLKKNTDAAFIGEPTGGKPNHYGEVRTMKLTNIGVDVSYSINYFDYSEIDTESFIPDIIIEPSINDYCNEKDAVLESILSK